MNLSANFEVYKTTLRRANTLATFTMTKSSNKQIKTV